MSNGSGLQCNYGVRFDGPYGIDYFMNGLATEVERRMEGVGVKGRRVTLKVKQRKKGARPPPRVREFCSLLLICTFLVSQSFFVRCCFSSLVMVAATICRKARKYQVP